MSLHDDELPQSPEIEGTEDTEADETPHTHPPGVLVECPNCGYRFMGVALVDKPCPSCGDKSGQVYFLRQHPELTEPLVEVHRAPNWLEAEMIREHLLSEGVLVAFSSSMPWGVITFTIDGLGEVSILAVESDAAQARKLIKHYLEKVAKAPSTETEDDEE